MEKITQLIPWYIGIDIRLILAKSNRANISNIQLWFPKF